MTTKLDIPAAEQIARELSVLTGQSWTCEPNWAAGNGSQVLLGPGQARLWLMPGWDRPGMLYIAGHYPATEASTPAHSINVGMTRPAGAVAASISHRLLPGYLPELARVADYNTARADEATSRAAFMDQVSAQLGGEPVANAHSGRSRVQLHRSQGLDLAYGDLEATGAAATVDLSLTGVPRETALAILDLLARTPAHKVAS